MIISRNRKLSVISWFCLLEATINISGEAWLDFLRSLTHMAQRWYYFSDSQRWIIGLILLLQASVSSKRQIRHSKVPRWLDLLWHLQNLNIHTVLSTHKIFVYTALYSCIRFMPSCILHRSIPSLNCSYQFKWILLHGEEVHKYRIHFPSFRIQSLQITAIFIL